MTFKKQLAIGLTLAMLPLAAIAQTAGTASSGAAGNAAGGNTGTAGTAATPPATSMPAPAPAPMPAPAAAAPAAAPADTASSAALSDQDFVTHAAIANKSEIMAGKIAEKKGSADVKTFAKEMVTDHTMAGKQLMALAKKKKLTVPKTVDDDSKTKLAALKSAKGADFSSGYVSGQVTDHEAAVALFTQEANSGTDPDLKSFAQTMLPTMQKHLDMAKELASKQS